MPFNRKPVIALVAAISLQPGSAIFTVSQPVSAYALALLSTNMPSATVNFCMAFPLSLLVLAGLWVTCLALQVVEVDVVAHVLLTGVHQWLVIPALQLALGQRLKHQAATALAGEHLLVDRRDVPFGPRLTQKRLEQWPVFR